MIIFIFLLSRARIPLVPAPVATTFESSVEAAEVVIIAVVAAWSDFLWLLDLVGQRFAHALNIDILSQSPTYELRGHNHLRVEILLLRKYIVLTFDQPVNAFSQFLLLVLFPLLFRVRWIALVHIVGIFVGKHILTVVWIPSIHRRLDQLLRLGNHESLLGFVPYKLINQFIVAKFIIQIFLIFLFCQLFLRYECLINLWHCAHVLAYVLQCGSAVQRWIEYRIEASL